MPHREHPTSRRDFLARAGGGAGMLALMALMEQEGQGAAPPPIVRIPNPLAARTPHFKATATSVIWLFLDGGPSQLDLFDYKPTLTKLHGKPLPGSFERPVTSMGRTAHTPLLGSKRKFKQHGKSGLWVSDWYPEIAKHADKLAVLKGCQADGLNHVGSVCQMNTGSVLAGRPSLGSWAVYGLGSVRVNLPGYVILLDYPEEPPGGTRNWGTGFMPGTYQGTRFRNGKNPILDLQPPVGAAGETGKAKLDLLRALNRTHKGDRAGDGELDARIAAYELAYKMQAAAPEAVDLAKETAATKKLYGLEDKATARVGRNCLLARRLVERGVRFVQLYLGSGSKWDAHRDVEGNHSRYCRESDRPIAGLLTDLQARGLLNRTLVVWGGEFGRTPMSESGNGRDHNPYGFTTWLAGGGVKGGVCHGATDEVGLYAVEGKVHVHDLHATILHCLGLNHKKLTLLHNGRDERVTINGGKVVKAVL
jgi:hypothetical protein